jgi:hypothetical protein
MENEELSGAIDAAVDALNKAAHCLDAIRKVAPEGAAGDYIYKTDGGAIEKAPLDIAISRVVTETIATLNRRLDHLEAQRSTVARR